MNKRVRESNRYSVQSLKVIDMVTKEAKHDPKGTLFMTHKGMVDLSKVNILHFGTDTIRQLYKGIPRKVLLKQLDYALDTDCLYTLLDHPFSVSKMGKMSGYRYKLQNNALGIIILVASYYSNLETEGTHLKIEVSPNFILKRRSETTNFLHRFASQCLEKGWHASAVAIHLCCDFQGYQPPKDFLDKFVTRTKNIKAYLGISDASFNLSEVATTYGDGQSFTFGKADALQVCLYRKDLEIEKHDKQEFWHGVWGEKYNPALPVWRIELRFHHTVLNELAQGMGIKNATTAYRWYPYLREIWNYGLNNNRLESSTHTLSPIWQLLRDDGPDNLRAKYAFIPCVREKKSVSPSVVRNIANLLGNMVSLYARQRCSIDDLWQYVQGLHIFPLIKTHLKDTGKSLEFLRDKLESSMVDRYLIGKAA